MSKETKITAAEYAECAAEALKHWNFDVYLDDNSPEWVERFKEALSFDEQYAAENFAGSDGFVTITKSEGDKFDKLEEFATNWANNALN